MRWPALLAVSLLTFGAPLGSSLSAARAAVPPLTDRSFDVLLTGAAGEREDCFQFDAEMVFQPGDLPQGTWGEVDLFFFNLWFGFGVSFTSYAFLGLSLEDETIAGVGLTLFFGIPDFLTLNGTPNEGCP